MVPSSFGDSESMQWSPAIDNCHQTREHITKSPTKHSHIPHICLAALVGWVLGWGMHSYSYSYTGGLDSGVFPLRLPQLPGWTAPRPGTGSTMHSSGEGTTTTNKDSNQAQAQAQARSRSLAIKMPPQEGDYTDYSYFNKPITGTSKKSTHNEILKLVAPNMKQAGYNIASGNITDLIQQAVSKFSPPGLAYSSPDFLSNDITRAISTPLDNAITSNSARLDWIHHDDREVGDLFDIVLLTGNGSHAINGQSRDNIEWRHFLEKWRFMLEGMHTIVIQQGDPYRLVDMPHWLDYDLFNKHDVEKTLGEYSWLIDMDSDSTTARTFGFMIADRDYVFYLDRHVLPAEDVHGQPINPLEEHLINLLTPSSPYYFNTHYDAFRAGSDFSRGYPHSLREGHITAISMGPCLQTPYYDTSTRFMKPREMETRRPDIVTTVPHSVLYSMSSANLAFNRLVAGPALLLPGFIRHSPDFDIGDKNVDVLVGWVSKVVLDNVLAGVKFGGRGYVTVTEESTDLTLALAQDLTWSVHEEAVVRFFNTVQLSPRNKDSAPASMDELSTKIEDVLGKLNPAYIKFAKAIRLYTHIWNRQHAFNAELQPVASRSSKAPPPNSPHKCAVFTIMHDEPVMLPLWLRYYHKHFPNALFVVQHIMNTSSHPTLVTVNSSSPTLNRRGNYAPDYHKIAPGVNVTHYNLRGDPFGYPVHFLASTASMYQMRFFRSGYKCVLYTDADEFIVPDPRKYPAAGGLTEYLKQFMKDHKQLHHRAVGYTVAHVSESEDSSPPLEGPMRWDEPILSQRGYWNRYPKYDKPLLSKVPVKWKPGFHNTFLPAIGTDNDLFLLHFTEVDKDFCQAKELHKYEMIKLAHPEETGGGFNHHIAQYPQLLAKGVICRYARGVFIKGRNAVLDRTGTVEIEKMGPSWQNVTI